MWNNLQQARVRLNDTVKAITTEAIETAKELRDAHHPVVRACCGLARVWNESKRRNMGLTAWACTCRGEKKHPVLRLPGVCKVPML
jgi:hypothetical protein